MARVLPQVENQLIITKTELDQLDTIVGQQPATFVIGIISFLQLVNQKRNIEAQKKQVAKIQNPIPPPPGEVGEKLEMIAKTNIDLESKTNV